MTIIIAEGQGQGLELSFLILKSIGSAEAVYPGGENLTGQYRKPYGGYWDEPEPKLITTQTKVPEAA